MHSRRLIVALMLAGSFCGSFWNAAISEAQYLSATAGPQQMVPSDAPAAIPSVYPSTATPGTELSALSPYPSTSPALMASVPSGVNDFSTPSITDNVGAAPAPYGLNASVASRPLDLNGYVERNLTSDEPWTWQSLPSGLMYKSYLAGLREPRFASAWVHDRDYGWMWNVALGGRAGLVRYGTENDFWPQGYQMDIEGAAFPRLDHNREMVSNDYRFGIPFTTRQGPFEAKFGYYHLSSHIGDEYLLMNPGFPRLNYVRESLMLGVALYLNPSMRLYTETGYAFHVDGGAKPWEFQFGIDCSPAEPTGFWGAPFFAINSHLRQENDFGGNLSVQTGWQWRGRSGHLCRIGMQYFNGMSEQYQFYNRFEEQIGAGLWYDF